MVTSGSNNRSTGWKRREPDVIREGERGRERERQSERVKPAGLKEEDEVGIITNRRRRVQETWKREKQLAETQSDRNTSAVSQIREPGSAPAPFKHVTNMKYG